MQFWPLSHSGVTGAADPRSREARPHRSTKPARSNTVTSPAIRAHVSAARLKRDSDPSLLVKTQIASSSHPDGHSPPLLFQFYRSLRAVKVLLAVLRSTLTGLAPRCEGAYRLRWKSSCFFSEQQFAARSARERNATKLLRDVRFTRSSSCGGTGRPCCSSIK